MGRGHDLLFDPPVFKKEGIAFLTLEESFHYPWDGRAFYFNDYSFVLADDDHIYQKDFFSKNSSPTSKRASDVITISAIGALSLSSEGEVKFYSLKAESGQKPLLLSPEGLASPIIHLFATQNNFDRSPEGTTIYAIDQDGDLYIQDLGNLYSEWTKADYDDSGDTITSFLHTPEGTLFFRGKTATLAQENNVFIDIRRDIDPTKSSLPAASRFLTYENEFLFLGPHGKIIKQTEEVFSTKEKIIDMAASGPRLALLGEEETLFLYQNGTLYLEEKLKKPYRRLLLDEDRLLLFSGVAAEGDHLDEATLYTLS